MKKNLKFFGLMAHLNVVEVAGFGKYLQDQYPNEGNALNVYAYYRRFYPKQENSEKMELSYAHLQIYGCEIRAGLVDRKKIWNAFSKLFLWLKEFLVLEKLRADKFTSDVLWLKVLADKGMTAEYSKETIKTYKTKYHQLFDMEVSHQQIGLSMLFKQQLVEGRPTPDNKALELCLLKIKEHADFISLKMNCEWLTLKKIRPSKEKIVPDIFVKEPLIQIYNHILLMVKTDEVEHYLEIEKMLHKYGNQIPSDETNSILRYMHNYAAKMIREADAKVWGKRLHNLNKTLSEKDANVFRKSISPLNFQNIVNTACSAPDFEWASDFINKYADCLPQKIREENVCVAQATIAFDQKDYKKVIELTDKPRFKDEPHRIRSKTLQLRALYELGLDVDKAYEAFNAYLHRHRLPEAKHKEATIAFMTVFNLLAEKRVPKSELEQALNANPQIILRDWLDEKIRKYKRMVY